MNQNKVTRIKSALRLEIENPRLHRRSRQVIARITRESANLEEAYDRLVKWAGRELAIFRGGHHIAVHVFDSRDAIITERIAS